MSIVGRISSLCVKGRRSHCLGIKASFQIFALGNKQVALLMPHNSEHVGKTACLKYDAEHCLLYGKNITALPEKRQ